MGCAPDELTLSERGLIALIAGTSAAGQINGAAIRIIDDALAVIHAHMDRVDNILAPKNKEPLS
jgi:hypothetical protein